MATIPAPLLANVPEPLRRRYGIFDAASGPLDLPPHAAGGGVRYVPVGCGDAHVLGVNCYTGSEVPPEKPLDPEDNEVETDNEAPGTGVFATLATWQCSPVGYDLAETEAKVRRRLEMNEQAAVERALWTGVDFEGTDLDIRSLDAQAIPIPYAATGPDDFALLSDVIAGLERWAYTDQGYGSSAYLHAPIEVAAFAAEAGLILPDGPRKMTPMGSVWVFGAYPAGEIIVTGQVTLWRGEVSVAGAFDNVTNQRLLMAERPWAASFDCFAGRAEYDPLEVTSA